jgi:hypothetical protein
VSDVILKGGDQRVERPSCCRVSSEFVVSCFYPIRHYSFKSLEEINYYKFVYRVRVRCLAVGISPSKGDPLGVQIDEGLAELANVSSDSLAIVRSERDKVVPCDSSVGVDSVAVEIFQDVVHRGCCGLVPDLRFDRFVD